MKYVDEVALMYRIANMYYRDNISQNEIAKMEGVSRSQISRLLEKSRTCGIVKITVEMPENPDTTLLQDSVRVMLGLKEVFVLPLDVSKYTTDSNFYSIKDAAELAAPILKKLLSDCKTIGVGWGRSLYYLSLSVTNMSDIDISKPSMFVPLCNGFGQSSRYLQPSVIANNFAERYNAETFFFTVPGAPLSSNRWSIVERSIFEQVKKLWEDMDAVIVSVGPSNTSENIYFTELMKSELSQIVIQPDISGEMIGMGFTSDGQSKAQSEGFSSCSYLLEDLQYIPKTIAFAFGGNKVTAIYYAAKNKLFNTLITDIYTAKSLLDYVS